MLRDLGALLLRGAAAFVGAVARSGAGGRGANRNWRFPRELLIAPPKWAERYFNLQHWTPMTVGGHFAPSEERSWSKTSAAHSIDHDVDGARTTGAQEPKL